MIVGKNDQKKCCFLYFLLVFMWNSEYNEAKNM